MKTMMRLLTMAMLNQKVMGLNDILVSLYFVNSSKFFHNTPILTQCRFQALKGANKETTHHDK